MLIGTFDFQYSLDERTNQTLQNILAKAVMDQKDQWDEFIDTTVFAYNTLAMNQPAILPSKSCLVAKLSYPSRLM